MGRSLRIPGLVDLIQADVRSDISGLADDTRLDRSFAPRGPLINRILVQRIRSVLRIDGVRGASGAPALGPATQQAIGRLFATDYKASPESWAAAGVLDAAVHTRNPLRAILLHLSGRLQRSRRLLADLAHGDLAGVHATGIAVHNLVRGFERMRELG